MLTLQVSMVHHSHLLQACTRLPKLITAGEARHSFFSLFPAEPLAGYEDPADATRTFTVMAAADPMLGANTTVVTLHSRSGHLTPCKVRDAAFVQIFGTQYQSQ